jgi:hypothetical protein
VRAFVVDDFHRNRAGRSSIIAARRIRLPRSESYPSGAETTSGAAGFHDPVASVSRADLGRQLRGDIACRPGRELFAVEGIIGVAAVIAAIECRAVVHIERQPELDPLRQIGIGDEMPSERDQVGVPTLDNRLGFGGLEPARRDDRPLEDLSQLGRSRANTRARSG